MIDRLGDLLRMTLHTSSTQEVPLKDELDVLQKYLEIEQTRFGNRLRGRHATSSPKRSTRRCRTCCCSRWSKTPIRHGIAPQRAARLDRDPRRARADEH